MNRVLTMRRTSVCRDVHPCTPRWNRKKKGAFYKRRDCANSHKGFAQTFSQIIFAKTRTKFIQGRPPSKRQATHHPLEAARPERKRSESAASKAGGQLRVSPANLVARIVTRPTRSSPQDFGRELQHASAPAESEATRRTGAVAPCVIVSARPNGQRARKTAIDGRIPRPTAVTQASE